MTAMISDEENISRLRHLRRAIDEEIAHLWRVERISRRRLQLTDKFILIPFYTRGFNYQVVRDWVVQPNDCSIVLYDYTDSLNETHENARLICEDDTGQSEFLYICYDCEYLDNSGCQHEEGLIHKTAVLKILDDLAAMNLT